ncbi:uncharacterized protein E5676_scaffold352G007360 [Cucumis melo var. makuwa]|uniref:Uncharacterized protein n=2 Tax=Cucumis melo TaxID=3656 RepID=A0A5A7UDF7_CUCMM|nr:uncharacterized protein E6C27_scaffold135G002100 [Cucumis melo var. makuwa]TYK25579.1 uncharacterized protein E5676_scaffold352G007360 [Cucumis melo var. makuwa]
MIHNPKNEFDTLAMELHPTSSLPGFDDVGRNWFVHCHMRTFSLNFQFFIEDFEKDVEKSSQIRIYLLIFCFYLFIPDERDDSSVMVEKDVTESVSSLPKDLQTNRGRENVVKAEPTRQIDMAGEINMEASMSADDVLRAGGFGARDEIGSFLPVASDSTDFEATILNARDYEGPQGEISRPGLGWKEATKTE